MLLDDWSRHSCLVVYIGRAHGLSPFASQTVCHLPFYPNSADSAALLFLTWILVFVTTDCDCS